MLYSEAVSLASVSDPQDMLESDGWGKKTSPEVDTPVMSSLHLAMSTTGLDVNNEKSSGKTSK